LEDAVPSISFRPRLERRRRPPAHVLLIDPSADSLEMYAAWFEMVGLAVSTSTDPTAALRIARATRPQVVVAEVRICRGFDGLELLERLRWMPEASPISRVVLTGFVSAAARELAERSGCIFLTKPCLPERLGEAIARLLRGQGQANDSMYQQMWEPVGGFAIRGCA
jgi:CheY-like chemotaxis protein